MVQIAKGTVKVWGDDRGRSLPELSLLHKFFYGFRFRKSIYNVDTLFVDSFKKAKNAKILTWNRWRVYLETMSFSILLYRLLSLFFLAGDFENFK